MTPETFCVQLVKRIQETVSAAGGVLGRSHFNDGEFTVPGMKGSWGYLVNAYDRSMNNLPVVKAYIMYHRGKTITTYLRKSKHMRRKPSGFTWRHARVETYDSLDGRVEPFLEALSMVMATGCGLVYDLKRRNQAPGCRRCPVELLCLMREGDFK